MINNKDDALPSPVHFLNRKATFLFSPCLNEWGNNSGVISANKNISKFYVKETHKTTESIRALLKSGLYFVPMGTFRGKGLR